MRAPEAVTDSASLRLGLNAGLLPRDVRWFYLQALGTAIRSYDRWSLGQAQPSEELAGLLGVAKGSARVVEIGAKTEWTAIALALSSEQRSVVSFARPPTPQEQRRYVHLVEPGVRARIDFRDESAGWTSRDVSPIGDLVLIDATSESETDGTAIASGEELLCPGGLLVVRGYHRPDVREAVDKLRLEGSVANGFFVGRKPLESALLDPALLESDALEPALLGPPIPPADTPARAPIRPRLALLGFALTGALAGVASGVGVSFPEFSTDELVPGDNQEPGAPAGGVPRGANGPKGTASPAIARKPSASKRFPRSTRAGGRSPSASSRARRGRSGVGAKTLSGTGSRKLGAVRVNRPMILSWTAGGRSFTISSTSWRFRTRAGRGSTVLSPGTYRGLRVRTKGRWSLTFRPAR